MANLNYLDGVKNSLAIHLSGNSSVDLRILRFCTLDFLIKISKQEL